MRKQLILLFTIFALTHSTWAATYDKLFIVGNATDIGWSAENALSMTKVSDGIFSWTGRLTDNSVDQGRFKFLVSERWEPSITCQISVNSHQLVNSGEEYDLFERPNTQDGDGFDNAFQVAVTGFYTVNVNLNTMKMTCTRNNDIQLKNWEFVKPEIGADGEGHVFPGVSVPFGMVKLGADCGDKNANSGWGKGGNIHGFSHLHVSGTGGGPKYGNILFQPLTGTINLSDYSSPRAKEKFALGLYEVALSKYDVDVRLTALARSGLHEYTFPQSADSKILIDAGSCLTLHVESQELVASGVTVLSDTEVEGYSTVKGGWNMGDPYTVYFYAVTDTPADSYAVWKGTSVQSGDKIEAVGKEKSGVYMNYTTAADQKIRVKVGISFISTQKAKENIAELTSWSVDDIRAIGITQWETILNTVNVEGTDNDKTIFYSALYHAFLQPSDRTGENPDWESSEPYYDDYYAIWDTFRATHPLFALLKPSRQAEMVRSLIDIYEHDGYMPDARSGNCNGRVQGGSNSDVLIADAIVKNLPGIDYEKGLAAMLKNAEVEPADPRKEGRGGLADYNTKGYISTAYERSGTRTFEYSNCDFAIATVAKRLGKQEVYDKYLQRSSNWKNLWNDNISSLGFKGFLWPKKSSGDWVNERDYNVFRREAWEGVIYESFPWEMSLYVPHDMNGLIARCGGKETFTKRLDTYFSHPQEGFDQNNYIGLFQVDNEPGFLTPTLYNYVNRPDKTAEIVRKVLKRRYNTTPTGLPGNDDSGSMSAWYAFHAMGFFPSAGQDIYFISSPVFTKTSIALENGKTFEVLAPNASAENIYVQSVTLNGVPLTRSWLKHDEIVNGGVLDFVMGSTPSSWGHDGEALPSSPAPIDEISNEISSPKVRIHSYSGQVGEGESAYCLFEEPSKFVKWCDNANANPWVVFELADTYLVDRFVFRDSKTVEGNNNVHSYRIAVSTTGLDADWEELISRNDADAGNANVKDHSLSTPKEARFVKFSMELPEKENAIRIYGFDIFGKLKERTDRGEVASVGKSVMKSSGSTSFFANPRHIIDGLTENTEYHWKFNKYNAKNHYIIIDLEEANMVKGFKIFDSNNVTGYNVYTSTVAPDLGLITNDGDNNSVWTLAAMSTLNKANKEVSITPLSARYLKLEIPQANIDSETAAVTEFEVLVNSTPSDVDSSATSRIGFSPNPVKRGDNLHLFGQGLVSFFSLEGVMMKSVQVNQQATMSTAAFNPGVYMVKFAGRGSQQTAKLIVK